MKYKVGDKVKLVKVRPEIPSADLERKIGEEGTIVKVEEGYSPPYKIVFKENRDYQIYEDEIEMAEPIIKTYFKNLAVKML